MGLTPDSIPKYGYNQAMTWFWWAASSIIFFSTLSIVQRTVAIKSKYPRAGSLVFNLWAVAISIMIFIVTGAYKNFALPQSPLAWIFIGIALLTYGLFERWRFLAAKLLEASTLSIISNLAVVVAFTGAIFLYSEGLTVFKILGAALVLTALTTVGLSQGKHKKTSLKAIVIGASI